MLDGHLEDVGLLQLGVARRVLLQALQHQALQLVQTVVDASSALLLHDRLIHLKERRRKVFVNALQLRARKLLCPISQ